MSDRIKFEQVSNWIHKSEDSLQAAEYLLRIGSAQGAINRMYYAAYHLISGLYAQDDITAKSHKGLKAKLGELYIQNGKLEMRHATTLAKLFKMRLRADYSADGYFTVEEATEVLVPTKAMLKDLRALITIA
ncbi:MAG: HEPN domain-containing protein [Bacteroidota bacterium]